MSKPTSDVFIAGRPGGYAAHLALQARLRALAAALVATGGVLYGWSHVGDLQRGGGVPTVAAAAALCVSALASAAARQFWGRAAAAAVGARSERRVAQVLTRLSPTALLHSVQLDAGGDADHLVAGPKLFVVETKTGGGRVSYDDHTLYVNTKALRGNPIAQCRRQALAAKTRFGSFCDAIVCVVDMTNAPFTVGSVHVCSLADLPAVAAGLPDRLRADQAWARAVELAPSCSTLHDDVAEPPNAAPSRPPAATPPPRNRKLTPRQQPRR